MPPQAQPKAKGAAKAEAKGAKAETPLAEFEPLSEEELTFCWLSLVDRGQLSEKKLEQFMLEICGERLSTMQVRDLLNYMDANGDGIVGREDFRNFVSIGTLADTNPGDFMWTPKRKYQEEHGTVEKQQKDEDLSHVGIGVQAAASFFRSETTVSDKHQHRGSMEFLGGAETRGSAGAGATSSASSSTAAAGPSEPAHRAATAQEPKAPEPKPPPGKRRGPAGGRTARTAATAAATADADSAAATTAGTERQEAATGEKPKAALLPKPDTKARAQIEASIAKYEHESWQRFLKVEEEFKEKVFKQFASSPDSMSVTEYHKMLMKWHRMARWSMPGDLRPADSLAALKYVLSRERTAQKGEPALADGAAAAAGEAPSGGSGGAAAAGAGEAPSGSGEGGGGSAAAAAATAGAGGGPEQELELPPDAKLSYKLWLDLLKGKYRPEVHLS